MEKSSVPIQEVLFVGAESAGKSLLVKNLKLSQADSDKFYKSRLDDYCAPTVGVDLLDVPWSNGRTICLRELGSPISSRWASYFQQCRIFMFVIDIGDSSNWSTSFILLHECCAYRQQSLDYKPALIVLNRASSTDSFTLEAGIIALGLRELEHVWGGCKTLSGDCTDHNFIQEIANYISINST
jgi:GTPase SAR1 family protein